MSIDTNYTYEMFREELETNPASFGRAKEVMKEVIGERFIILPEEGITAIEEVTQIRTGASYLRDHYNRMKIEFIANFWCEYILPRMNETAFLKFIGKAVADDQGEEFVNTIFDLL